MVEYNCGSKDWNESIDTLKLKATTNFGGQERTREITAKREK